MTHLLSQQDIDRHDSSQHHLIHLRRLFLRSTKLGDSFKVDNICMLNGDLEPSSLGLVFLSRSRRSRIFEREHDFALQRFLGSSEGGKRRRREEVFSTVEGSVSERRCIFRSKSLAIRCEDLLHQQQRKLSWRSVILGRFLAVCHSDDRGNINIVMLNQLSLSSGESDLVKVGEHVNGVSGCSTSRSRVVVGQGESLLSVFGLQSCFIILRICEFRLLNSPGKGLS